jgi:hypothetical protein
LARLKSTDVTNIRDEPDDVSLYSNPYKEYHSEEICHQEKYSISIVKSLPVEKHAHWQSKNKI